MKYLVSAIFTCMLLAPQFASAQDTPQSAIDNGNTAQAQTLLQEMSTQDDAEKAVSGLCGLAQIESSKGSFDKSNDYLQQALEKARATDKKKGWTAVVNWLLADNARKQNDIPACKKYLQEMRNALEHASKISPVWKGTLEYTLSLVETDNENARDAAEAAIDAFDKKFKFERGLAYLRLADLEWARDKQRRAFKNYDEAIDDFKSDDSPEAKRMLIQTLLIVAQKKIDSDDAKGAKSRLASAQKEIEAAGNPQDLLSSLKELEAKIQ